MTISHVFPHEDSTFIYILVHHMHGTIKKKIIVTHIYRFKLYSLSLYLSYFFIILISFGYTHEFTPFFYWVFDNLFILDSFSFAPH